MSFRIGILQMAHEMAVHSTTRQSVIAQNIANADTPDYKAKDVGSFADSFIANANETRSSRSSRVGHLELGEFDREAKVFETNTLGTESPNGNTVSLEEQLVNAAEVKHEHELALGIYGKSIEILRAGMGRIR